MKIIDAPSFHIQVTEEEVARVRSRLTKFQSGVEWMGEDEAETLPPEVRISLEEQKKMQVGIPFCL